MKQVDAQMDVIGRLLAMARLIRRRGTPEEAGVALRYEAELEKDLNARRAEIAELEKAEQGSATDAEHRVPTEVAA